MMKKNFVVSMLVGALFVAMMLTSCVTNLWNEEHPESETAVLFFYLGTIVGCNDVSFEKPGSFAWISDGDATVIVNMRVDLGSTIYVAKGMEFDFSFEAGKKYGIAAGRKRIKDEEYEWGVYIYDGIPAIGWPKEKDLIAYVPFTHQPIFAEK